MATDAMLGGALDLFGWSGLPEGWQFDLLGNRCTIRRGASPRPAGDPKYFGGGTIPWIKIGDATRTPGRYIESTEEFVNEAGAECSVRVPPDSLIIANSGVSLGFAAITRVEGCIHDGWLLPTDFRELDRDYLYYCISLITERIRTFADGTTQPNLNTDIARRLLLPMPPLSEQRAIASALRAIDDKVELNRRMSETLESMARALFKSWFVDFDPVHAKRDRRDTGLLPSIEALFPSDFQDSAIGEVPKGWSVSGLTDVVEVNPHRPLRPGAIAPYLDMANMPQEGHSPTGLRDRATGSGARFENGDTLVARITPCLENGKTAFVDFLKNRQVAWGSTEYIVLRPRPPLPAEYGYCLARSPQFRDFAIQSMTGSSGRQRVPVNALAYFNVVIPPAEILGQFGDKVAPLFERARRAADESRLLAVLRDALLPKLVSGAVRLDSSRDPGR